VVAGEELHGRPPDALRSVRRHLQLVHQNPFTSLDPTWRVERLVREPLDRFGIGDGRERAERVRAALAAVHPGEHLLSRRPSALAGGQRQRVATARALVLQPDVVVLDEPTSALDVSVQAGIVAVLLGLQAERGLTHVLVSHDLSLVRRLTPYSPGHAGRPGRRGRQRRPDLRRSAGGVHALAARVTPRGCRDGVVTELAGAPAGTGTELAGAPAGTGTELAGAPAGTAISPVFHGTPDEVAAAVLADPGPTAADEVVPFLPPAFGLDADLRLIIDLAATAAPAWGWSPG
jgi:hypothetical protein